MKQKTIHLILKILAAVLAVLCSYFGVTFVTSCTVQRSSEAVGRAIIITSDTTIVNHHGSISFRNK